jgi:hypothetical protein
MGRWSALAGWSLGFDSPYQSAQPLDDPRAFTDAGATCTCSSAARARAVRAGRDRVASRKRRVGRRAVAPDGFKDEQLLGSAFGVDAVGRTHAVGSPLVVGPAAARDGARRARGRARRRARPSRPPALARVTASPNPARGRLQLAIETPRALPPGSRARPRQRGGP